MRNIARASEAATPSAFRVVFLALTLLLSLPASAQQKGVFDLRPLTPLPADFASEKASSSLGKQPYRLGATRVRVKLEEEQPAQVPAVAPSFRQEIPRPDRLTGSLTGDAIRMYGGNPALDVFQQNPLILRGRTQTGVRLLSDYDVELIVDSSQSMRRMDCPGGLSRWDWCGVQAKDLGRQLHPYVPRGLTITAFARYFEVYRNATPENVADLFANPNFRSGTRLAEALTFRLNEFFLHRSPNSKPLLIAVITDGVPRPQEEPEMVANSIINASKLMKNPREVKIVFFQIGARAKFGQAFLKYLDNGLVKNGARYDFVTSVPFEHLTQVGLAQALIESIEQFAADSGNSRIR